MHERTTVRKKTGLRTQMMTLMLILCTLALLIQGCLLIYASVRFYSEKAYDDMEFFLQTCNSNFSSKMLYVEGVVNNLRGDPMMQSFFSDEGFNWVEIRSQFEFCTNIVSEQNLIDSREPFVSEIYLFNRNGNYLRENYYSLPNDEQKAHDRYYEALFEAFSDGEPVIRHTLTEQTLYLFAPFYDQRMQVCGMFAAGIDRTALGTLIDWQSLDCEVVYMARSGQDVLDHIGQYRPDLLITDIRMPGVDGVELANRLSGSELPIPIIFLTAYTDFSYAQAAVRYSVADYIVKPNVLEELPQAIRRIQERFGMQPAEQRRRVQQEVLRALLDDTFTVEEQPRANLAAYAQLKSGGGPFQLIVVQDLSGQLRRLAKTCFAQWDAVMFSISANEFAFLLLRALPERAQLEQACGALLGFSSSLLQMVAGVCVSEPFSSIDALRAAYDRCSGVLCRTFREQAFNLFFAADEDARRDEEIGYHQQLDRFFASLQGGSPGQIDAELEALLSACEKGSVRTVRSVGVLMLVRCLRILREINPEYSQIFIDSAIQDRIYEFKSMWEFRRLAQDMTMQMRTILSDRQNQTDWLITEVNDFIAQNYCGHVTLAEIADSVHVNRSYLSRIYKERTGKNVFDVINARRVEKAKELLQTTNMRVYEVALFVGFEDAAYFSRFFKRYTGVSPKKFEYRGGNL